MSLSTEGVLSESEQPMDFVNVDLNVVGSPGAEISLGSVGLLCVHEEPGLYVYELDRDGPTTLEEGLTGLCDALERVEPAVLAEVRAGARLVADAGYRVSLPNQAVQLPSPAWGLEVCQAVLQRMARCGLGFAVSLYAVQAE